MAKSFRALTPETGVQGPVGSLLSNNLAPKAR